MQTITPAQCGELLAMWLQNYGSAENAKEIAKEIGYNDSPLFGAAKKKVRLVGEFVMLNSAIAIFAANQVFDATIAKPVIDSFLSIARNSIFHVLEEKDSGFKSKYEQRMAEYFGIFARDRPALGLSFSFMEHLGVSPLSNMQGQVILAARFGESLGTLVTMLGKLTVQSAGASEGGEWTAEAVAKARTELEGAVRVVDFEPNEKAAGLRIKANCFHCKVIFSLITGKVPLVANEAGRKGFLCEACMTEINGWRRDLDLKPFHVPDGAYPAGSGQGT